MPSDRPEIGIFALLGLPFAPVAVVADHDQARRRAISCSVMQRDGLSSYALCIVHFLISKHSLNLNKRQVALLRRLGDSVTYLDQSFFVDDITFDCQGSFFPVSIIEFSFISLCRPLICTID